MIIGIDGRELANEKGAGKAMYVREILPRLFDLGREHQFVLYLDQDIKQNLPKNVRKVIYKAPSFLWHLLVSFRINLTKEIDLYFAPTSAIVPTFLWGVKKVFVVMDLVAFLFKEKHTNFVGMLERIFVPWGVKGADKVLAISESTKRDVREVFGLKESRVTVVPLAARDIFIKSATLQDKLRVAARYRLPKKFLLFVGTIEPRKNIQRIVESFKALGDDSLKLVLIGQKGWLYREILELIKEENLQERIVWPGYVQDADLPSFYALSEALVWPSLYEGFGLPILEAMSVGTPVVTSNISSMPEVAGSAAILVDPKNTEDVTRGIKKALKSRGVFIKKGKKQAARFDWDKTAQKTWQTIKEVGAL